MAKFRVVETNDNGKTDLKDPHIIHTLASINNMGFILYRQGKLDEAEPYLVEALEVSRRVLGDEHPDTLVSIKNLARLFRVQGKYAEAEPRSIWRGFTGIETNYKVPAWPYCLLD